MSLMAKVREAIVEDKYPAFLKDFFQNLYGDKEKFPEWAVNALRGVGVDLLDDSA
jgi:queuine tRNA-ribosyltransferase